MGALSCSNAAIVGASLSAAIEKYMSLMVIFMYLDGSELAKNMFEKLDRWPSFAPLNVIPKLRHSRFASERRRMLPVGRTPSSASFDSLSNRRSQYR